MKKHTQPLLNKAASLKSLIVFGQLRMDLMIISFVLLLVSAAFEGFSFGLLVPFLKQAAGIGTYEGWKNIPLLGSFLKEVHFESIYHRIDLILCVIVVAVILRQLASYVSQVLFYSATFIFESKLRVAGYERLLSYGCAFYDNTKKSEMHNTLMRFTQEVAELMRQIFGLCQNVFFAVIYVVVLLNISLPLSLTVLAVAPLFYVLLSSFFKAIHRLYQRILKQEQKSHGLSYDVFSNIKLVKAMGREEDEVRNFKQQERGRAKDNVFAYSLYLLLGPLQEILMTLGIAAIIWICFTYFFKGENSFLIKLIVSLLLFRRTVGVLNSFLANYPQVIRRLPFVREYRALVEPSNKTVLHAGSNKFERLQKGIEYRNVSMGYSSGLPVLKNISFFCPKGSFTAIVGASGTGKSTLVELLPRFYDFHEGEIFIDDTPIREFTLKSLRQSIGFVSQDTLVLNDTIFNNILYAKPEASPAEVLEATEKARVSAFIQRLPEGIHTVIGDKGIKISGGELQRLAIARVILRKPQILILDEATSALDSMSEQLIQEALNELAEGRTTLVIAHRLSTIRHADQILVMQDGRIAESGKLEDLLNRKGLFAQYWTTQQFQ